MLKQLFLFLLIFVSIGISSQEAKSHSAILAFINDEDDQDALNEEKNYEVNTRNDHLDNALEEAELLEKTYGTYDAGSLFNNFVEDDYMQLEMYRPIVPSSSADDASLIATDPEAAVDKFITNIKNIFSTGQATNFNEAVKKKNQMTNLMSAMSYGQIVSAIEFNNRMKIKIDEVIEEVNGCETIDCTTKHTNKLDLLYNTLLVEQLFLLAGDVERIGFASIIATNDSDTLE